MYMLRDRDRMPRQFNKKISCEKYKTLCVMFLLRQHPRVSGRSGSSTSLPGWSCCLQAPWLRECVMTRSEYVGRLSPFRLRAIIETL